jgi:hypothetical protein
MSIHFTAPPTIARFMLSEAFIRIIVGPIGSGKTTGCLMELLRRAIEQRPGPDGLRRTRWAIVRTTLSQLKMSVLLDILSWFREIAVYKVTEQLVTLSFNDVLAEIYLIPLEEEEDQKRLLSMQLTGVMVNEGIELSVDLISAIAGRCGRFPSAADGGPSWFGIICDTNAPVTGSDWWRMMEHDKPADWDVFWQPDGLSPEAENVENLPPGYYQRLALNPNADWVRRYVNAQYGEDPSGVAVFKGSFRYNFHVVASLDPVRGQVVLVGQDFGRHPCSLITQVDHAGRLLILEEVHAENVGLELHVTRSLKPRLWSERYFGLMMAAVGDPSGRAKGNFLEEDSFDVMLRLGVPCFPAPTNDVDARIRAVETLLLQQRDGGPAVLVDGGRCPMTVRALNGAYRYGKTSAGETRPLPEKKHPWSDFADDLQYVALTVNAGLVLRIARKIKPKPARRPASKVSAAGWT